VVIVTPDKLVEALHPPVPLELVAFGLPATLHALRHAQLREGSPPTPDGGVLADHYGAIEAPAELASMLDQTPGVVEHGLFPPALIADVIVGRTD
jgi:ribose 5-phosphate isomerase A